MRNVWRVQVEAIEELDVGHAALLNSTLRAAEWREAIKDLEQGDIEFVFLAPEQFNMVLRYEGDKKVVLFDSVGYKLLAVNIVLENHLLEFL